MSVLENVNIIVVILIGLAGLIIVLFPLICFFVACFAAERTKNEIIRTNQYLEQIVKNQSVMIKMMGKGEDQKGPLAGE